MAVTRPAERHEPGVARSPGRLGPAAYGALFVLLLPVLLLLWGRATAAAVTLPAWRAPAWGGALAGVGLALMAAGMRALFRHGGGLPMNAYPPPRLVKRSVYALLPHPIYVGSVLLCAGVSALSGSASGLWLVTPALALGAAALVWGWERPDLERRFGVPAPARPLGLPPREERAPRAGERAAVYLLVFLPWAVAYEAVRFLGVPADGVSAFLPFEAAWPVLEWSEALYASTYLAVLLAPLAARRAGALRDFALGGALAALLGTLLFVTVPLVAFPRPFTPTTALGRLLAFERAKDTAAAAFPSFHVTWALLAALLLARSFPRARALAFTWGAAASLACLTTGQHALVDVVAGALLFALCASPARSWEAARRISQRLASSWREARVGPMRLMSHGAWAGLAAAAGLLVASWVSGHPGAVLVVGLSGLAGAGLWAQLVEGSPRLLRPFGYYGGVLGGAAGAGLVALSGGPALAALAAWGCAGPIVQAVGRLRCLVNGCCHGRPAPHALGILYTHPKTRPCRIAELEGVPIHPTQTYSILWNLLCAPILLRLWIVGAPLTMVGGLYLLFNGVGRFVEEAYRGEPQTPRLGPLPIYQWMGMASAFAGSAVTAIASSPAPAPAAPGALAVVVALAYGLLTGFAMGVDFPDSDRRFARLA